MIEDVANTGDRRKTLEAIRQKLAADMDAAAPAVSAQLASQLVKVLAELAELGTTEKVSVLDDLANRRKDRLAKAGVPDAPKRQTRKRG